MGQEEMVDAIQYAAVRLTEQPSNKRKNIVITKIGELINYGYLVPVNIGGKEMLELKK
jgi:adenine C2-methylase RlmN of 23S rRNA A2503 and tRNA A37